MENYVIAFILALISFAISMGILQKYNCNPFTGKRKAVEVIYNNANQTQKTTIKLCMILVAISTYSFFGIAGKMVYDYLS